jgi:hypothetical protein
MRELFFAADRFSLFGEGDFAGTFHLFKETVDGKTRTGRELKGTFASPIMGVNAYRFGDLRGALIWVPDGSKSPMRRRRCTAARRQFGFKWAPLGVPNVRATATFDASYDNVDLTAFSNFSSCRAALAGRASGANLMDVTQGRFAEKHGNGEVGWIPAST